MEDEGTLFALFQPNITTTEDIVEYLYGRYFLHATKDDLRHLVSLYDDPSEYASPFRTGDENNWYPQCKRLAAIIGDFAFIITRRGTLEVALKKGWDLPTWGYMNSMFHGLPVLGSGHGLDIIGVFYGLGPDYATRAWRQYYVNFINNLDPNEGGRFDDVAYWPTWAENKTIIQMHPDRSEVIKDDFRQPVSFDDIHDGFLDANHRTCYRSWTICSQICPSSTFELGLGPDHFLSMKVYCRPRKRRPIKQYNG